MMEETEKRHKRDGGELVVMRTVVSIIHGYN